MVSTLANFWISFLAGLSAPLFAVCILPLYPGFISYLASQLSSKESKKTIILLGFIVVLGVLTAMALLGLIFTKFLQASLTNAIGIISPIAFGILAVVSLFLIFDYDFTKFLPQLKAPVKKNPYWSSFLFGLFFGAIVIPCNPAPLIVLFAVSTTTADFFTNLLNFLFFGLGMGLPLLILTILSASYSELVISWLSKNKRMINLVSGIIMLAISLYYLIFVFKVFS